MANIAMPNLYFSNSHSNYNSLNGILKYRPQRSYNKNHAPNLHLNYEDSSGSWENVPSVFPQYGISYRDSQTKVRLFRYPWCYSLFFKMSSDWRIPTRAPRRFSHSVDAATISIHQNAYLSSLNISSSKYSIGSSANKRTSSQPDIQPSIRLTALKSSKHSQYRPSAYGTSKYQNILGSTLALNKFSPKRESPIYSNRSYHWQNSKNFRNTSEGPQNANERQKLLNGKPSYDFLFDDKHQKHSYDDLTRGDELRKGDILRNRYQIVQEIGRGSFGNVYKAIDTDSGRFCAVKRIKHISNFRKLAEEEISMLKVLSDQDKDDNYNFLHLNDHFNTSDHTYMVFDLLSINLYQLIHRNNYRGFAPRLVRKFVRCILNCLHFLHRCFEYLNKFIN